MVSILSLWLPILVSALLVFVVSAVIHMLLKYHTYDYRKIPNEDAFLDALRRLQIPSGEYSFPRAATREEMKVPAYQEKMKAGPLGILSTMPGGRPAMAGYFVQWFVYCLIVGIFSAYIAGRALGPGAPYLAVFRFAGATAFTCYVIALWQNSIWFMKPWATTLRFSLDGLIYALLTAGVFGWLWPR